MLVDDAVSAFNNNETVEVTEIIEVSATPAEEAPVEGAESPTKTPAPVEGTTPAPEAVRVVCLLVCLFVCLFVCCPRSVPH